MATKDDENAGLLAKVVRFVRSPGTPWAEGEVDGPERDSSYSKQMLKEMIERKRRNDFVRRREFDQLRKLRRRETVPDTGSRQSFFQSSMPSKADDRAVTLKKIDEIEAQMSMQWWKTKQGAAPGAVVVPPSAAVPDDTGATTAPRAPHAATAPHASASPSEVLNNGLLPAPAAIVTGAVRAADAAPPGAIAPAVVPATARPSVDAGASIAATPSSRSPFAASLLGARSHTGPASSAVSAFAPTEPGSLPALLLASDPGAPPAPTLPESAFVAGTTVAAAGALPGRPSTAGTLAAASPAGYLAARAVDFDTPAFEHDPALEEAAIQFANGDVISAEESLRIALAADNATETWLTLFDLYRASGQHQRFETAALEFAGQFGRSAPQWIAMGVMAGTLTDKPATMVPLPSAMDVVWRSSALLGVQAVSNLQAALARTPSPWTLDWAPLKHIEPDAVDLLAEALARWSVQPVQLQFIGARHLEDVLGAQTPSGDASVSTAWWRLRLELLRVLGRPDEFELVALDYCVTYEVSPPSWQAAVCQCVVLQDEPEDPVASIFDAFLREEAGEVDGATTIVEPTVTLPHSDPPSTLHAAVGNDAVLEGEILGDASTVLQSLERGAQPGDVVSIDCGALVRVDFSGAGSVLNWAAERQAVGSRVQFRNLHRLIAVFFNIIGIQEHARITVRRE